MSSVLCHHFSLWWGCPYRCTPDLASPCPLNLQAPSLHVSVWEPSRVCVSAAPRPTACSCIWYQSLTARNKCKVLSSCYSLLFFSLGYFMLKSEKYNPSLSICSHFSKMSQLQAVRHAAAACAYASPPAGGRKGRSGLAGTRLQVRGVTVLSFLNDKPTGRGDVLMLLITCSLFLRVSAV